MPTPASVPPDARLPVPGGLTGREFLRATSNPSSLRAVAFVLAGLTVLLTPTATTSVAQVIVIVALAFLGVQDLVYAATGRRWIGRRVNRVLALFRALAGLAAAAILALLTWAAGAGSSVSLSLVVGVLGAYVVARGLMAAVMSIVKHRGDLPFRLAAEAVLIAFGALAFTMPDSFSHAAIVAGAVALVLIGILVIAWGLARERRGSDLDPQTASVSAVLWDWLRIVDVGRQRREELAETLYFERPSLMTKVASWWAMLVLSVAIATYAVLADSTAVVIGAMLVAPLMVPILGLAGAIVNGWGRRATGSLILVCGGVAAAVGLSFALSSWAPVIVSYTANTQILSRIHPNTLDMLIALAAGAAGAVATVSPRVSSSIAGVAIAVALVPPLSVVGISLSAGNLSDAAGAMLLFLTNFVAIVLSAAFTFVVTGFASWKLLRHRPRQVAVTVAPFLVIAALIMIPLTLSAQGITSGASDVRAAERSVATWLGDDSGFSVDGISVTSDDVTVELGGEGSPPDAAVLQAELAEQLGREVGVTLRVSPVEVTTLPPR
ncbi:DUF389 domain-containing protein [Tessaracoccus palaemonis]|uniref:DUF389 domain-containing protein n=1 Tax=Tessaracoccus palaemonis TaxID=2829499 RepID=A0ABX8SM97_9ACTN|nr:DUF389 domain-containing protein [Tessaracoccus palaemonis]QXT63163.1 DUF389 domain-containing protein [Tessaracoccus palaemonis]